MERLAFEQLHGQKRHALVIAEFVYGNNILVDEIRSRTGLMPEPLEQVGVGLRRYDLYGHVPAYAGIPSSEDLPKATLAEGRYNLISANAIHDKRSIRADERTQRYPFPKYQFWRGS